MKDEIEVKFASVDHDEIREKLKVLGAKCVKPMRLMNRANFDIKGREKERAFVRVRDEGDGKVTVTYKEFFSDKDVQEAETFANSFDEAMDFCKAIGLLYKSCQEQKRETWTFEDYEIVLDEWPWLDPLMEIEAPNFEKLKEFSEKLGFDFDDGVYGDITDVYRVQYPHIPRPAQIGILPEMKFGTPLPDYLNPEIKLERYGK